MFETVLWVQNARRTLAVPNAPDNVDGLYFAAGLSVCHFQDQGGIEIGDDSLIGHNVVLAAINHELAPLR